MLIAPKICLKPNKVQASYFARAAGSARFAYNWALAEGGKQYQAWKRDNTLPKPSHFSLSRALNAIKKQQFPWILQVSKRAPQIAIIQLGTAFQKFFAGRAKYPNCCSRQDRDVNAALNLRNMAVSFTVSVAGEKGSGLLRVNPVQPASMKQKASSKLPLGSFVEVW